MVLRKLALGSALLSMSNIFRLLLQFITLPILSRILDPSQYGAVAIAMPFVLFAQIFSDGGLGQSLVKESPERWAVWSTIFWIIFFLGCAVAAVLVGISPFIAMIYGQPILQPIVATLALACVVQAMMVVPAAALQRAERFSTLAISDMVGAVLGAGAALWFAAHEFGAWALVAQQLTTWLTKLVTVWLAADFVPRPKLALSEVKGHLRFSRDIITFNVINFFARSFDPLVIGKVFGANAVGKYTIAYQMMRLPSMLVTGPVQNVFYTHVVKQTATKSEIKTALLFASRLIATVVFPTMGLIAAGHHPIFRLFLSDKWAESGTIFMLFAAVASVQAVTGLNGSVFMATGRTGTQIKLTTEFTVIWIVCLLVSANIDLILVPIAYSISWFFYFPRFARMFLSVVDCSIAEYASTMLVPTLVTTFSILLFVVINYLGSPSDLVQLFAICFLILGSIALGGVLQAKRLRTELSELGRS